MNTGFLIPKYTNTTYIFGESPLTSLQKVLQPDGQWTDWLPDFELQRDKDWTKSNYGCVSYSNNNCKEILFKRLYGYEINIDDRDLVVGSGTVPYVGNDIITVAEWHRKNGFILEKKGTVYNNIPVPEFYQFVRSEEDKKEALNSLELFNFGYEMLVRETSSTAIPSSKLIEALKYSPIQVTVDGRYTYNEFGEVCRNDIIYSHEVVLVGYTLGVDGEIKNWKVFDSCHDKIVYFCASYRFGYPMVNTLIPKNSMKLFRQKDQRAIYFLNPADNKLVAFADGVITGGSMFKILFGDYKFAPTKVVDELPYPVADYQMTTI